MRAGLAVAAIFVAAFGLPASPAMAVDGATCSDIQIKTNNCPPQVSNNGTWTEIVGEWEVPGTSDSTDGPSDPNSKTFTPTEKCNITTTTIEFCPVRPTVNGVGEIPEITLTDLEQFAPAPVTLSAEPSNAGIADMPTNFLGAASAHTQTGSLFGFPVTVRFTPVGYDYDYGDGTSATVTAGRTWEDLGQAQFTPTPTSHVYTERGTYTAALSIRYSAEVDLGRGWYPVAGQLTIPTAPQQVQIFEAHTALVAHTCTENPTAPGC